MSVLEEKAIRFKTSLFAEHVPVALKGAVLPTLVKDAKGKKCDK